MGLIPGSGRSPEEGMATHSSVLAWEAPWTEKPAGYSPWDCKEFNTTEHTCTHTQRNSEHSQSAVWLFNQDVPTC